MANFKSDIVTAKDAVAISDKLASRDLEGRIPLYFDPVHTLVGTEAASDTIQLCDIPPGATILPGKCHVVCSADPGTTLTLDIGHADDTDGIADGIVLSNGGQVAFTSGTMPAEAAAPILVTEQTRLYATVASAATLTADVKLLFHIECVIKG